MCGILYYLGFIMARLIARAKPTPQGVALLMNCPGCERLPVWLFEAFRLGIRDFTFSEIQEFLKGLKKSLNRFCLKFEG